MLSPNNNAEPTHKKQKRTTTGECLPRASAMRLALEDPDQQWHGLPTVYKHDVQFVAEFIRNSKTLPCKNLLERTMPQDVRMSKAVTLAFVSRDDFAQLYADRQLYCPHNLCNDKEIIRMYCQKIPRALQMADMELCDDAEIVAAAVSRAGFEIQYASVRLQADEDIIRMACQQSGQALEVCAQSPTLQRLLADREFLLMAFRNGGGGAMRLVVDKELLQDDELWLEAVAHGLSVRYVPAAISSASFWEAVMRAKSSLYHDLRREFRENPNVARAALFSSDLSTQLLEHLYENLPDIFDGSRNVALAVVRMGNFAKRYLQIHRQHFQDAEVMLIAVQNNPSLYFDLDQAMLLMPPIITAALTVVDAHRVLQRLGRDWLQNQETLCIAAIQVAANLTETANAIPDEMWRNSRALALAWVKRGCRVLHIFEDRIQDDREMALAVAQYVHRDYQKIGTLFREDMSFVREAVHLNGRNLKHVPEPSLELVVSATATYPIAAANHPGLAAHVKEKLALSDMFRRDFLRGVCSPASTLFQLNVDSETSTAYKMLVAQFLGVPTGTTLTLYNRCQASLQKASLAVGRHNVASEPLDLPVGSKFLRASLRGGNPNDGIQMNEHHQRLANLLFDDGVPFNMLRRDQQRVVMANHLARINDDEEDAAALLEEAENLIHMGRGRWRREMIRMHIHRGAHGAAPGNDPEGEQLDAEEMHFVLRDDIIDFQEDVWQDVGL